MLPLGNDEIDEAIDYFKWKLEQKPEVVAAIARCNGSLVGLPDGSFLEADLDLIHEFIDDLEVVFLDEYGNTEAVQARYHKRALVGKELAPYV